MNSKYPCMINVHNNSKTPINSNFKIISISKVNKVWQKNVRYCFNVFHCHFDCMLLEIIQTFNKVSTRPKMSSTNPRYISLYLYLWNKHVSLCEPIPFKRWHFRVSKVTEQIFIIIASKLNSLELKYNVHWFLTSLVELTFTKCKSDATFFTNSNFTPFKCPPRELSSRLLCHLWDSQMSPFELDSH